MHWIIFGELAMGNLKDRQFLLGLWRRFSFIPMAMATHDQALGFVESQNLMGKGISWIDAHLLVAVSLANRVRLWTRDKRLRIVAESLGFTVPLP